MNRGKKSFLQQDMALADERIRVLQGLRNASAPAAAGTPGDKTVQTSEFAFSDALDTVKEKEIQPDKPRKGSLSD